MKRISIVKNFIYFLIFSLILLGVSAYLFFSNLKLSIEFTGGMQIVLLGEKKINVEDFKEKFKDNDLKLSYVIDNGKTDLKIRSRSINTNYDNKLFEKIKDYLIANNYISGDNEIVNVSFIGPTVGKYMKSMAEQALVWGIVIMGLYILVAFVGVREYFQPWIFSIVTILTLLHDVIMAVGAYGLRMYLNPLVVVNTIFVLSILTVLGYSINDTIIIFDRVRENIQKYSDKIKTGNKKIYEIFDMSLYQTMKRSLLTSLSTFLVVLCMYIFGNQVFKDFSFVIMGGIIFGTYSSIFLAAPGAYWINRLITKKE